MRPFSLLIKPAGADCNLRCEACFYLDHLPEQSRAGRPRMSEPVLERLVSGYLACDQPLHSFAWQGGEPTLMGQDFFERVVALQRRHARPGAHIENALQTNATLIDEPMAALLARHHFLVGVSLDGPAALHDRQRKTAGGQPTHAAVLSGLSRLRRHGVDTNALVLVTRHNVGHATRIYHHLLESGCHHQQYIPCVEFDARGRPLSRALDGPAWGDFLCELFDAWIDDRPLEVSIRRFHDELRRRLDGAPGACTTSRDCRQYFVVEHDGAIYPCDFFVQPGLRLGSVLDTSWEAALEHPVYRRFGVGKLPVHPRCADCDQLTRCQGDCPRQRLPGPGPGAGLSLLCTGWQRFWRHAEPGLERLAEALRRRRACAARHRSLPQGSSTHRVGRNAPCPCGSGRKTKRCCGR